MTEELLESPAVASVNSDATTTGQAPAGDSPVFVSHTRMAMLSRCGEQFRRRYLDGDVMTPGAALIVGGAVDRSVTTNMRHKLSGEGLLSLEAVADFARDECSMRWSAGEVLLTDDEVELGPAKAKGEAVDKSVRLAQLHASHLAPSINPTHVQRGFDLDLSGAGYPAHVVGYLDLQEPERIIDTKTSKRSPGGAEADTSLQLGLYALAAKVLDGALPAHVQLDYLVDLKTPKVVRLESSRDEAALAPVLRRIERFIETVQRGHFQPASPDDWACSRQWCGFFGSCRFALRPVSVGGGR